MPQFVKTIYKHPRFYILINFLLASIALGGIFYTGNTMLDMDLWGYYPLYFFLSCWLLGQVLVGSLAQKSRSRKYLLLSSLSGILFHLSFPDPSITPLIFTAFLPLLYIAEKELEKPKGAWRVFRYSYSGFLLWNILTTFWVANTSFVPSIVAFTLNSLFMTIPFMLYFHFRKRFPLVISLIAFAAFWLSFEMIHLRWEISWPWLTLGNAFSSRSLWIQWYEYTGHLGGSVWVLLMNALVFFVLMEVRTQKQMKVTTLLFPMFGLVIPMFASFFVFFGYQEKGDVVNVAVVQPNFEPHYEKFDIPSQVQLDRFLKLSSESVGDSTDYLIFPETSFGAFPIDDLESSATIRKLNIFLDSFPNLNLVTGLISYRIYDEKEEGVDNLRAINRGGETKYMLVQNSAVQLKGTDQAYDVHVKGKLVPGAEIFPYSKLLFFLEPIVKKAGGSTSGHQRSLEPSVFKGEKATVGPSICYESIYGYWMKKYVEKGADLIFVVTNDGWWDNTPGHRQHLGYSVLRAIELRKSIARSANTGVSCIIDQHGRVFNTLEYGVEGTISTKVQANSEQTFYARHGDLLGRLAYLLSAIFLAFMFRKNFKKEKAA